MIYIGIDIGGTHIRIGKGAKGKVKKVKDLPTKTFAENKKDILNTFEKIKKEKVTAVGVSIPGPIGFKKTTLIQPNKFHGWTGINLANELSNHLKLPVFVSHDASLAALAEYKFGSQKNTDPLLYITVSTGIGVGVINSGQILHGLYYPHAGHMYVGSNGLKDWCGQQSDLESTVSGWALQKITGRPPEELEGSDLWYKSMDTLSKGICNFILSYSPAVVIIGGGMTKHKNIFFEPVINGVKKYLKIFPVPPIYPTTLEEPSLLGAITLAENPSVLK